LRRSFSHSTQKLLMLAKDGDVSALDQLYRVYGERVRLVVRLRMNKELRSRMESMDIVQDALVHALGGLDNFTYKNEGDFIRWLSKIVQNILRDNLDKLHADKRDIRKEVRLGSFERTTGTRDFGVPLLVDSTTPSAILANRQDLDKLEMAMDALKPAYREVIVMTKIEGLSYGQTGEKLSKSEDAVRMLVARAMASLVTAFRRL
jgi:RNA polymerase sigma-70 factor (ECF subfamily)